MITTDQIEKLASRKDVRRIAVVNFLGSIGDMTYQEAVGNVEMDAQSYRWNHATVGAIREGLLAHFFGGDERLKRSRELTELVMDQQDEADERESI